MIDYAPVSKNKMTLDEAIIYCSFLEYNGHRDWRVPTHNEYWDHKPDIVDYSWYLGRNWNGVTLFVQPVRTK